MCDPTKEIEIPIELKINEVFEGFVVSNRDLTEDEIEEYKKKILLDISTYLENKYNLIQIP